MNEACAASIVAGWGGVGLGWEGVLPLDQRVPSAGDSPLWRKGTALKNGKAASTRTGRRPAMTKMKERECGLRVTV